MYYVHIEIPGDSYGPRSRTTSEPFASKASSEHKVVMKTHHMNGAKKKISTR